MSLRMGVGLRLAGLADGEGHFMIAEHKRRDGKGVYYSCGFRIKMRDDDVGVLRRMRDETGLGKLYTHKGSGNARNAVSWQVNRKSECLQLVDIFTRYPLWSKKQRDFSIWKNAVILWSLEDGGGPGSARDWSEMRDYFYAIRATRAYSRMPSIYKEGLAA